MKITDDIIVKFFGHSNTRGFTVQSIKRYGGFIRTEEDLEDAHYLAMKALISARDRGKEFVDELHMINYMQQSCYFAWCTVGKRRLNGIEDITVNQSSLIVSDDDGSEYTRFVEPGVDPVYPNLLTSRVLGMAMEKFGQIGANVVQACIIDSLTPSEAAKKLGVKTEKVKMYLRVCTSHLKKMLKNEAEPQSEASQARTNLINSILNENTYPNFPKQSKGSIRLRNSGNMDSRYIIIG